MQLTNKDFEKILKVGIRLSTEKSRKRLLVSMLENGMKLTNCDAGILYLYENEKLFYKIIRIHSRDLSQGENGENIPVFLPITLREKNVCVHTALHRTIANIPDIGQCDSFDFSRSKQFDSMCGYQTKSMLVVPIENNEGELIGVLQLMNAMNNHGLVIPFDKQYHIVIQSMGLLAAIEITNLSYVKEIKEQLHSFVEALSTAIDERTPYNGSHTRKVAEYASHLADYINYKNSKGECDLYFDEERKEKLLLAALLHDIGKMVVPLSIMNRATRLGKDIEKVECRFRLVRSYYEIDMLRGLITEAEYQKIMDEMTDDIEFIRKMDGIKILDDKNFERVQQLAKKKHVKSDGTVTPYITQDEAECLSIRRGTLTEDARKQMENHVVMTEKILDKVHFNKNYEMVPKWAATHHEFLNGTGYPNQLMGEELDLESRILTIADIFDALTARDRPYKKPMSKQHAIHVLKNMADEGKLDKQLVSWLEESMQME